MWVRGAIAALVLLASLVQPVQAERAKGVTESPGAKLAIDEARRTCRKARGLKLTVGAKAIRNIDLNGDGRPDRSSTGSI